LGHLLYRTDIKINFQRHLRMKSATYYLILLVLKLKGVKREFSKSPIDWTSPAEMDTEISPGVDLGQEVIHGREAKAVYAGIQAGSGAAGEYQ
jgi:high-affinity Fe2+/Pb2+ permease